RPLMPARVTIFKVTKLRPGLVTMTRASTISRSRVEPWVWVAEVGGVFISVIVAGSGDGQLERSGGQLRLIVERADGTVRPAIAHARDRIGRHRRVQGDLVAMHVGDGVMAGARLRAAQDETGRVVRAVGDQFAGDVSEGQ